MLRTTLTMLFLLTLSALFAQKVTVKKIEMAGEQIIVHYDLDDGNPNNEYQISLYSSKNAFSTPLAKVSGDVGDEVKIGYNKKIVWNVKEELGPYKGRLSLEVRGKVFLPIAKFTNVNVKTKMKRGKAHPITWKAGSNNAVHIELLKNGQRIAGELNQPNNGSFSLYVPPHAAVGKDYTLRITDSKNSESVANSQPFTVTHKVPTLLKVVPIFAIGGVVAVLASGGGSTPPDNGGGGTGSEIPLPTFPSN